MASDRVNLEEGSLSADLIAQQSFSTVRRGFDPEEVRSFLAKLAAEMMAMGDRMADLESDLRSAEYRAAHPVIDEETLLGAVGEGTAHILRSAHQAAADIKSRGEENASRILKEAHHRADGLRAEAETVLARRTEEAEAVAAKILDNARVEADRLGEVARQQAKGIQTQSEADRQALIAGAQASREKILTHLARKRKVAVVQVEQLLAGRERLLESYQVVRETLEEVTNELARAETSARAAADAVRLRPMAVDEPETGENPVVGGESHGIASIAGRLSNRDITIRPTGRPPAAISQPTPVAIEGPAMIETADVGNEGEGGPSSPPPMAVDDEPPPPDPAGEQWPPTGPTVDAPTVGQDTGAAVSATTGVDAPAPRRMFGDASARGQQGRSAPIVYPANGDGLPEASRHGSGDFTGDGHDGGGGPDVGGLTSAEGAALTPSDIDVGSHPSAHGNGATPAGAGPPEPTSSVESLFARLREDREKAVTHTRQVLADPEPSAAEPAPAVERPVPDADEAILQRRDEAISPIEAALTKRLKRVLQDDQNDLLDRLRGLRTQPTAAFVLPARSAQTMRFAAASLPLLAEAASAGSAFVNSWLGLTQLDGEAGGGLDDLAADLANAIIHPLRRRLEEVFAAGAATDDRVALAESIGAAYRECKTQRIEATGADHVVAAFARGGFAATPAAMSSRWLVEDADGPCPDCDDNVLAGDVPKGEAYPTGQLHPPAHPGCRCLVVPRGAWPRGGST